MVSQMVGQAVGQMVSQTVGHGRSEAFDRPVSVTVMTGHDRL